MRATGLLLASVCFFALSTGGDALVIKKCNDEYAYVHEGGHYCPISSDCPTLTSAYCYKCLPESTVKGVSYTERTFPTCKIHRSGFGSLPVAKTAVEPCEDP